MNGRMQQNRSSSFWRTAEVASAAGAVATAAMTAFIKGWQQAVPQERTRTVPPREVTKGVTEKAGVWQRLPPPARTALTWVSHFGYGEASALAYAATLGRVPAPAAATGALFGLGVWVGSYAGWLPAFRVFPPPEDKPASTNAMMIGAHLVFGSVLGATFEALQRNAGGSNGARRALGEAPSAGRASIPD